ncbi:hypothetical protein [Diaminobutyricibacter sp. McL0608]|uniref:hypothetical protein n=1 Tax=Leifsonia sp. McL0608 TaxID=3143537 RepID=UPI0031F2E4E1
MTAATQGPARAEFTRPEIIDGLRDLVRRLRNAGRPSRIQIVGGAAIALTLNEHRSATVDVDGPVSPPTSSWRRQPPSRQSATGAAIG